MLARPRALALLLVLLLSSCAAGGSALARPASPRSLFATAVAAHRAQPRPGRATAQASNCADGALCGDGIVADPPTSAGMCPPSAALFESFESCMCANGGACAGVCAGACSSGLVVGPYPLSPDCQACWQRETGALVDGVAQAPGCAGPFNACVGDG